MLCRKLKDGFLKFEGVVVDYPGPHGLRPCLPAQGGDAVGVDVADFSGRWFLQAGYDFIACGEHGC